MCGGCRCKSEDVDVRVRRRVKILAMVVKGWDLVEYLKAMVIVF